MLLRPTDPQRSLSDLSKQKPEAQPFSKRESPRHCLRKEQIDNRRKMTIASNCPVTINEHDLNRHHIITVISLNTDRETG